MGGNILSPTGERTSPTAKQKSPVPMAFQVATAFVQMDQDKSGEVDLKEFKKQARQWVPGLDQNKSDENDKEVAEAFRYFDADGDGTITLEEFAGVADEWDTARRRLAARLKS